MPNIPGLVIPALILELLLYFSVGLASVRSRLEKLPRITLTALAVLCAILPYLAYSIPTGLFQWKSLAIIISLAACVISWYSVLPRHWLTDTGFLILMGSPILFRIFNDIYPDPYPKVEASFLGTSMWIRTGVVSALCVRGVQNVGFGFVPTKREWLVGAVHYVLFLPTLVLALALDFVRFRSQPLSLLLAVGTFLGFLWFVALSEEFFFRGLMQQWVGRAIRSEATAIALVSICFGLVHLGFRNQFPNWKFALLAGIAGVFYGRAYARAGSIRAAMVTHALVVTTWRVFFH